VRTQRGMTLVELVVAMSVMSILLLGIGSVIFVGYHAAGLWDARIGQDQAINQLTGALDEDVHQYVPCPWQPAQGLRLDLCQPSSQGAGPAYSAVSAGTSWTIVRKSLAAGGSGTVLARGLTKGPEFIASCHEASNVDSGYVGVQGLQYPAPAGVPTAGGAVTSPPPLVVYFRAPHGSCGGSRG
jgi:prepilin-type N-terminal cleavage/methylation domain-containing protein